MFSAVHSYQVNQVQVRLQELTRLKNSTAQDIVYCVSGGKIKTSKNVLFPAVVKSLCNIVEVIELIIMGMASVTTSLKKSKQSIHFEGHQGTERKSYYLRRGFSG